MMPIGTLLLTWWKGELVGQDGSGNRYYREKNGDRRWVLYAGKTEASGIPAEWNGWLHHTFDEAPSDSPDRKPWERDHEPNRTGTSGAYLPPGHVSVGGERAKASADYEAWTP